MRSERLESALESVSRVITDRYGLDVICEGDRCCTDGRTIHLPSLPEDVDSDLLGVIRGWADHECAHAVWTENEMAKPFTREHGRQAFSILNVLEDVRVERLMASRYPGSAINLDRAFSSIAERARAGQIKADPFGRFISALYTRAKGIPDQDWVGNESYRVCNELTREVIDFQGCDSTQHVADVALRVWAKVRRRYEQQQQEQPEKGGSRNPSSDKSEGNAPGEGQAGGDDNQQQDPHKQQQQEGQQQEDEGEARNDASEPSNQAESGTNRPPSRSEFSTDSEGAESLTASPMDMLPGLIQESVQQSISNHGDGYRVYTRRHDVVEVPDPCPGYDPHRELERLGPYVRGLRRRLVRTLMGKRAKHWRGDRTRGSLDPRALHRLATGHSSRIFRKRVISDGGHTACSLLLDVSSSMSGQKIRLCRQLGLLFAETLSTLGFPTEVIGFSTVDSDLRAQVSRETGLSERELSQRWSRFVPLYHVVVKSFHESWKRAAPKMGNCHARALTPLGESLVFVARRLLLRPERRKVLFCLTDGLPVVGAADEGITMSHACESVERISAAGIEVVGIGIMEDCVEKIFPEHAVIHELHELPKAFLKELCAVLSRRPI